MKMFFCKGCKVFAVYIMDNKEKDNQLNIEDIPILKDFKDIFPEEILGLPLKRDIDFTIDLVPGEIPASKAPYLMNIIVLIELKSQIQELIDKKYIRPSVSSWGALVLFAKKNDDTL